jgi:predicted ATP-grasp superfamily ATP-dependent carboligase
MHHLVRRLGIPTAQAVFPRSREDVLEFVEGAAFPVMLKGIDGLRLRERGGERMFIVQDRRKLLERYDALEDAADPNLMLQEYIPGGDDTVWMFNGYFDARSECLVGFTGKKLRQYPVHRGSTSLGICLRNDAVERMTRDFMKAIGYRGILDIGYRFDARDGLYKVLDVNPRIGATFRLFVAENGLDVVRAMYLDLTGQPVPAAAAREGRKWVVEDHDLLSLLGYRRDGGLELRKWAASLRGVREAAYFAADDPLPLLAMCANDARTALQRFRAGGGQAAGPRGWVPRCLTRERVDRRGAIRARASAPERLI